MFYYTLPCMWHIDTLFFFNQPIVSYIVCSTQSTWLNKCMGRKERSLLKDIVLVYLFF